MVGAWLKLVVKSAVVAAVVAAAQLGAGDALGVIGWAGPHDDRAWTTLLTWIAFVYATAVLVGALGSRAAIQRAGGGVGARVLASVVAAGGAAAVIGLAWLPARWVVPPVNVNPGLVISLTAGASVLVGLLLAVPALSVRPVAAGLLATITWVWVVAVGAAVAGLSTQQTYPSPRLAVPDAPSLIPPSEWTGPRVMVIVAGILGLVVAATARGRGASRLGAAFAGFGGPALVAAAYLIAGPGQNQSEAYLAAVLAVAVGLAASAVVAIPGRAAGSTNAGRTQDGRTQDGRTQDGRTEGLGDERETPAEEATGDVLISTRAPVPAGAPAAATTPSAPARPSWAEGSGPVARAYSSVSASSASSSSGSHAAETTTPPLTSRGTSWDADTLHGTTHGSAVTTHGSIGRHADRQDTGGGLYRSSSYGTSHEPVGAAVAGPTAADPHESWRRDLGPSGRHAAAE